MNVVVGKNGIVNEWVLGMGKGEEAEEDNLGEERGEWGSKWTTLVAKVVVEGGRLYSGVQIMLQKGGVACKDHKRWW